jgi:hypothetical protein
MARGYDDLSQSSLAATRFRPGHQEGYAPAFANLSSDFAKAILARELGERYEQHLQHLPNAGEGVRVMQLFEADLKSHDQGGAWIDLRRSSLGG